MVALIGQGLGRRLHAILGLPPVRRFLAIYVAYDRAGGSLLAKGLAYSALFAGLTGLLFAVGILGYVVPSESDRQRIIDGFSGQLAPLAPIARDALDNVASHAGTLSIIGLVGLAWGASQFYVALDNALSRVFSQAPARGTLDRILRGFVSVFLLVGGLLSGIAISALESMVMGGFGNGHTADAVRALTVVVFPVVTAVVVVVAVGVLYRVVPNMDVPLVAVRLPAVAAGLVLTALTELLVYIAPLLTGALSVFGGVAVVFAALAWLQLAFQVLLIGASWTRVRLDEANQAARLAQAQDEHLVVAGAHVDAPVDDGR